MHIPSCKFKNQGSKKLQNFQGHAQQHRDGRAYLHSATSLTIFKNQFPHLYTGANNSCVVQLLWNLSYLLTQSASESVDKLTEQRFLQAHALRTQPILSSEHQVASQPSQAHFLSSLLCLGSFSTCPKTYYFWIWKEENLLLPVAWTVEGSPSLLSSLRLLMTVSPHQSLTTVDNRLMGDRRAQTKQVCE